MLNVMRKKMIEKLRIIISKLEKRARESRKSLQIYCVNIKIRLYVYKITTAFNNFNEHNLLPSISIKPCLIQTEH